MWRHFKVPPYTAFFALALTRLTFVTTSQDQSFIHALSFVLANKPPAC